MTEDKQARWKGAGMGEYYCSLCCEVSNVREQRYYEVGEDRNYLVSGYTIDIKE